MARPRAHDEGRARRGAVLAFLKSGFHGTSLSDLEAATGLDRRQLYNQFGDKRGVLIRALRDFSEDAAARFLSGLEGSDAGARSIRDALHGMIDVADTPEGRLGCLICNTSHEAIAASDPVVHETVHAYFGRIESAYVRALRGAAKTGEIELELDDVERAARHLLGAHVAICVLARAGADVEILRDVAEGALVGFSRAG